MSRVFIVGSGPVGSATGRALLQSGHRVTFVDSAADRIAALTAAGLDARPSLDLTGEPAAFVFLCLPTQPAGDRYQLGQVENGAAEIGLALAGAAARHTVVVRSAVPPGSTELLIRPLLESCSATREGDGFSLAVSPEGLTPRVRDGQELPGMSVIAARSRPVAEQVRDLLAPLRRPGDRLWLFDDPATAELIKCADSLFSAARITFWKEIWEVCCVLELNPDQVASAVAASAEASFNPMYGLVGVRPQSGVQLPRDTRGFLRFAAELGLPIPLLSAVVGVNTGFENRLAAELDGLPAVCAIPRSRREPELGGPRPGRIPRQTRLSGPPV